MYKKLSEVDYNKLLSNKQLTLGKRDDCDTLKKKSFEAAALSIGFSREELEALGKAYPEFSSDRVRK